MSEPLNLPISTRLGAWPLFILVGVIGILLSCVSYGPGLLGDSTVYLSSAQRWLNGDGFVMFDSDNLKLWPVFYPFLLGSLAKLGIPLMWTPYIVNLAGYLILGITVLVVMSPICKSHWSKFCVFALALLSPSIMNFYSVVCSDGLFLALCFLQLWLLTYYRDRAIPAYHFVLLLLATATLPVIRYIGVLNLLFLFVFFPGFDATKFKPRLLIRNAIYTFLVGLPFLVLYYRNTQLPGPSHGKVPLEIFHVADVLLEGFNNLGRMFFITGKPVYIVALWGFLIFGYGIYRMVKSFSPLPTYAVVYFVFLAILCSTLTIEAMPDRYLLPLFPIFILLLLEKFDRFHLFAKLFVSIIVIFQLGKTVDIVRLKIQKGTVGYATNSWMESPTLKWVKESLPDENIQIYSNSPEAIFGVTQKFSKYIPFKGDCPRIASDRAKKYLVFLVNEGRPTRCDGGDYPAAKQVMKASDGAVFEF